MDREYPFLFCSKSGFWLEYQMMRQNIFEKQKRQTPKMTFVYILKVADRLPFVLENADKGLHTETGEDDGNPTDGSEDNGFSAGFDHS